MRRNLVTNTLQLGNNPVGNSAVIRYEASAVGKLVLRITDASGRTWLRKELQAVAGANNLQLDVSSLSKGSYFLEARLNNDRQVVKFVK